MFRKWLFPLACVGLVIISMLPPYTQVAYDPRNTQDVISSILRVSIQPYQTWGWIFHLAILLVVLSIVWKPKKAGRVLAGYIAANYIVIAAIQTHAITDKYGFALQTGALMGTLLIGIAWLMVAVKNSLQLSLQNFPRWSLFLLPFAILVFWSPIKLEGEMVLPNFNPLLLFTSADFGLTYCFVTPVFLYLLILFATDYTSFAFRVTAFNALLYGLFNLTHWFNLQMFWMGVMHLPLVILSIVSLLLSFRKRAYFLRPALNP